ncbi:MAG TPA: hypothetical protein VGN12_02145 [Pirellulales bacterium]|jgi:hypothetical protein
MNNESRIEQALQSLGNAWPAERSIATDVMRRINGRAGHSVAPRRRRGLSRFWMAAAAVIALVAGLWWALRMDNLLHAHTIAFDKLTALDNAVYREDHMGITYAIHRAERFEGGGIALLASVRGTPTTLERFPIKRQMFSFGRQRVEGPALLLRGSPQGTGCFTIDLASVDCEGIDVRWFMLVPRGTPPGFFDAAPDKVRIPVGFTPQGDFGKAEFTDQRGVTHHATWDIEIPLAQPETLPDLDAVARHVYSDMASLDGVPYRQLDMGVSPGNRKLFGDPGKTTAADFAQAVASHLRFWQQGDVDFQLEGQFTTESRKQLAAMAPGLPPMPETIGLPYQPLVDDALLERVAEHKSLKRLYLNGTKITDAGLERLGGLGELEELSLEDTAISDAGLVHLATLASLKELSLGHTRVTPEGVARLKQAIPTLAVKTDPSPRWWYGLSRELTAPRSP